MADFCGRCLTDEGFPAHAAALNDMLWPIRRPDELAVHLCEGCGQHAFNGVGWPICHEQTQSWYENPDQSFLKPCRVCEVMVKTWGVEQPDEVLDDL